MPAFLIRGLILELLKAGGTWASSRDAFIILVISGTSSVKQSFNNHVGIGSSSHDLFGDFFYYFGNVIFRGPGEL